MVCLRQSHKLITSRPNGLGDNQRRRQKTEGHARNGGLSAVSDQNILMCECRGRSRDPHTHHDGGRGGEQRFSSNMFRKYHTKSRSQTSFGPSFRKVALDPQNVEFAQCLIRVERPVVTQMRAYDDEASPQWQRKIPRKFRVAQSSLILQGAPRGSHRAPNGSMRIRLPLGRRRHRATPARAVPRSQKLNSSFPNQGPNGEVGERS